MEIKINYKNGDVEVHRLPELVGEDLVPRARAGRTGIYDEAMPRCDLDRVADIVERFSVEPDGLYMERRVVLAGYGEAKPTNGGRRRILSSDEFDSVECVTLDGEVVWGERGEPVEPGLGGLGASFM